jgi:hypothetical protein
VDKNKYRRLQLFGHVCSMGNNRLIMTVILDRAEGIRQKKRDGWMI